MKFGNWKTEREGTKKKAKSLLKMFVKNRNTTRKKKNDKIEAWIEEREGRELMIRNGGKIQCFTINFLSWQFPLIMGKGEENGRSKSTEKCARRDREKGESEGGR
jgi:hypothetical protein